MLSDVDILMEIGEAENDDSLTNDVDKEILTFERLKSCSLSLI